MSEQRLRAVLAEAAADIVLPERFVEPELLVRNLANQCQRTARQRWLVRLSVAAVVLVTLGALSLISPVRQAVGAGAYQLLSWIRPSEARTMDEYLNRFRGAKQPPSPPAELERQREIDVATALDQHPFMPPLENREWRMVNERAQHPLRYDRNKVWSVDTSITSYIQRYEDTRGQVLYVGQGVVTPPTDGGYYEFPPETEEAELLGYPAYLSSRHAGVDDQGEQVIREYPSIRVFVPLGTSDQVLEVSFTSPTASLGQVRAFAVGFLARTKGE